MSDEAGAAADARWRHDEKERLAAGEAPAAKPVPECPTCEQPMAKTGTLNRGEHTPVRVFQCMNRECTNRRRYNREGVEIW